MSKNRKIYNIEALRKHLNCNSYAELEAYGYDVDGYFSEQKYKKHFTPRKNEGNKFISKSQDEDYEDYEPYNNNPYSPSDFLNFSNPARSDYMGT